MRQEPTEAWVSGQLALALLAVDPAGLGGLHLRARAGDARDRMLATLPEALLPLVRIGPSVATEALTGGTDLVASLASGRVVQAEGLLARDATLTLAMAERLGTDRAAMIAQALDQGRTKPVILLDEGCDDEAAPDVLTDRCAFSLSLDGLRVASMVELALDPTEIVCAQDRLTSVDMPDDAHETLVLAAAKLGIVSPRAIIFASRAARANAALNHRDRVISDDLQIAAQLVFASRALCLPDERAPDDPAPAPEDTDTADTRDGPETSLPDDLLVEAVKAILPPDALAALTNGSRQRAAAGRGAGSARISKRRGRPLPARAGRPDSNARLDLLATLRAAAPWQTYRRKAAPDRAGLILTRNDFRVKRFEERSERLIIFAVDASGSSAMARLAEAKGAVELMLADAYAKRDQVALIAFRGTGAEIVLPPTRALVQAKRRLGGLPGGGGTPLAEGLRLTAELARRGRSHGLSPAIALMTDGRANIALDGTPGRNQASEDAKKIARLIGAMAIPGVSFDTGVRATGSLAELSAAMGTRYVPLPRADAHRMSAALTEALGT
ncbi:magnesium chelatase subunit D [Litorisediminicola beolgyonensis]|uniref:Magnesium chelatase subunit D n=1 Tax=Litorisediminicola beolgyonensis TaxID=1173614 RepID=A0ABW3ZDH9_9RHOB